MNDKKCIQNFGMKPEGKGPLQIPRRKLENNIKMYMKEIRGKIMWFGTGTTSRLLLAYFRQGGVFLD